MTSREEIQKRALRAAHAVTMGAIMMAGCTEDAATDANNGQWNVGGEDMRPSGKDMTPTPQDMSPVLDMRATTQDMPPTRVDMSQLDLGSVDMNTLPDLGTPQDMSSPDMRVVVEDMAAPEDLGTPEDMTPLPTCDGSASDLICPGQCTPSEDVDCCTALNTPQKSCAFSADQGCVCEPLPACSDTPDNTCPSHCTQLDDVDCCDAQQTGSVACTYAPGTCSCEAVKCSQVTDGVCPDKCTGFGSGPNDPNVDADCCELMQGCQFSGGYCGCVVPGPFLPPVMPSAA